jgi:hypothetical protein
MTQCSVKDFDASARSRIDCSMASMMTGLDTLSSKWPWLAATAMVVSFPKTLVHTMVSALHRERKLIVELAVDDLAGNLHDRFGAPRV